MRNNDLYRQRLQQRTVGLALAGLEKGGLFVLRKTVVFALTKADGFALTKADVFVLKKTDWIRLNKDGLGTSLQRRIGRFEKNGFWLRVRSLATTQSAWSPL